jgi:stage II sporulation protein AA (anti-sigma F factor antagonist)
LEKITNSYIIRKNYKGGIKLEIQYLNEDKILKLKITEELDHHAVEKLRRKADYEIERYIPRKVIFDFNNVSFMDSAGIGLILGRYKNVSILGGKLEIINVSEQVNKILKMTGVSKLVQIKEGCA